jgi:NAD(P)-dependent dehydrogenase (short-subunit alcohol dehydrogenase family)
MGKAILITGASSGIGKATAERFAGEGWTVIATMRDTGKSPFVGVKGIHVVRLEVRDGDSIKGAVKAAIEASGGIDVLLNNAGYGLRGIFECSTEEQIKAQFDTNVFGLISMVREILPHMRERGGGLIINVSSVGGRIGFPLYSLYQASKFAVEGFTEALAFELKPFGIKLKLVEPGFIKTDFHTRSMERSEEPSIPAYADFVRRTLGAQASLEKGGSPPEVVADTIYRAATDGGSRLRYPAGPDAKLVLFLRSVLPFRLFSAIFGKIVVG